ncbi:hypothetical protein [Paenibacillus medicaginis]|uniref:WD40 repeat domain-containing protein n=1 Tax=Paenibacillus medicaginis TaxID=1470560 RepID=A0ABV5BV83_9BACL
MKYKRFILGLGTLSLILILLSGCNSGPKTETIVIPGKEEVNTEDQSSRPFQVKKIYRLPDDFANASQLLGWSSSSSVVAAFKNMSIPGHMMLKRLTYPYEKSEQIPGIQVEHSQMTLSPDGQHICESSTSASGITLKLISLSDGKETEVAKFSLRDQLFLQDVAWSSNSKYLAYLVIDPSQSGGDSLRLYDIGTQTSKTYQLKDFPKGKRDTLLSINVSDDGRGVLFTVYPDDQPGKTYMMMGTVTGSDIELQYKHQIGREENAWITNDQFVFLGTDGTLYEYDRRNSELSVLLEKVGIFTFSHDKKSIAYSLYDQDIIYAGKMQGKNILYNEPVYRGILPTEMYWNLNNSSLFIYGQKLFSPSQVTHMDSPDKQSFIIEFQ